MSDVEDAYNAFEGIGHWFDPLYSRGTIFKSGKPYLRCRLCGEMFEVKLPYKIREGMVFFYIQYVEQTKVQRIPNICDRCFKSIFEGSKKVKKRGILDRMRR